MIPEIIDRGSTCTITVDGGACRPFSAMFSIRSAYPPLPCSAPEPTTAIPTSNYTSGGGNGSMSAGAVVGVVAGVLVV